MHPRPVFHLVSFLLMVLGLAMALCAGVGWIHGDPIAPLRGMALASALTILSGVLMWGTTRHEVELTTRDGIGVVTFGWVAACLGGTLPFLLTHSTPTFIDALFEVVSGLTTTGASIIPDPALLPRSVLFWRALTHFFGGMGILVLCVAILPLLGSGGMQIYRAETSGVSQDRLKPRIASTAKLMWGIYLLLNAVLTLLLRMGGMSWFDALCHAFAAVATGGFSTQAASVAAYNSLFIEICLIVFMFMSATNFALHYRALQGRWPYFRDAEFRFYFFFWLACCLLLTGILWHSVHPGHPGQAARAAFFTGTSLLSTTGFCTEDFDLWPAAAKIILVLAMLVGGCAGSTAGAIKQVRLFVVLKRVMREIWQFMHPQAVVPLKLGRQYVEPQVANHISTYFGLYLLVFALASLGVSFFTDGETAITAVVATLGGVGPGFALAGGTETYAPFAAPAKAILILCMLMGRLEFYALFAILSPRFWRR
jgi:trk system potassium uptake protein TrkH